MSNHEHESRSAGRRRRGGVVALALSSAATIGLLVGMNALPPAGAANPAPAAAAAAPWHGYADLVERIMPAVVTVTTTRGAQPDRIAAPDEWRDFERQQNSPFRFFGEEGGPGRGEMERFMERFFGNRLPGLDPRQGPQEFGPRMAAGSGFIISPDGLIVTNNHVIAEAGEVKVTLSDDREFTAEIVGADPDTDLALLKIETDQPLPVITWANSDQLRVGDPVVAIGNPFGLGGTVTAGIVSAKAREIGAGRYDDFLQIDAPINHGNSGGPTFNLDGQVVGVNTAIQSPTGGNVGIGFAIPANLAKRVIADLEDDGMVERGWLGVQIQNLDQDLASSLGLPDDKGALVAQVMPDSPALAAGIEQGDVILDFAGKPVHALRDLTRAVADFDAGKAAPVTVWQDGKRQTIDVTIAQMPNQDQVVAANDRPAGQEPDATPRLGLALATLTPEARASLDLPAEVKGVVVTEVQPGSPAAEKGLQQGDVIIEADHKAVTDPAKVVEAVKAAAQRGDETVLLLVKRDGQDRFVALRLERA
jgi:serine protease Do